MKVKGSLGCSAIIEILEASQTFIRNSTTAGNQTGSIIIFKYNKKKKNKKKR